MISRTGHNSNATVGETTVRRVRMGAPELLTIWDSRLPPEENGEGCR